MTIKPRRRVKVNKSKDTPPPQKQPVRNNEGDFAGGLHVVIGNTASVNGLVQMELIDKDVYGLFDNNPNYSVIEGNILDTKNALRVIEPVFSYKDLLKVFMTSTVLRQCVDSYVTNIESYGIELEYIGPEGQESGRAAQNEKARFQRLLATLTSDERTLQKHREDSRVDKEVLGARCFEVIRDMAGRVVGFDHVPTVSIRMTSRERETTIFNTTDPITGASLEVKRRFRRFIQIGEDGKKTWFKEFGDPRPINPKTGLVDNTIAIEDQATEIYYDGLYVPGTPCGMPRWVGAMPALLGSREAEMVNLNFFRDNAIPALAVLVSGGALTEESFDKIDSYIAGVRGQASMNRIVVMEAVSSGADAAAIDGSQPAPKVDIKPMLSERQHEGLFRTYIEDGETKARSAFRLPPVYIGSAKEYNRASAFASMQTADQQIFVPERMAWDDMFNRVVVASHGIKYWRARSTGPGLQDPQEVSRIVSTLGKEGAMTPNIAIKIANRFLDANIQPVLDDWGDFPFSVISSYVSSGQKIKGMDSFLEDMAAPAATTPPANTNDPMANAKALEKVVHGLLDNVTSTLQEQLDDALDERFSDLQSIVSKAVEEVGNE